MKVLAFLCMAALAGCAPASPQKAAPQDPAIQSAIQSGQQNYQQKTNTAPSRAAQVPNGSSTYGGTGNAQKKQMKVCRSGGTTQYLIVPADQVCASRP